MARALALTLTIMLLPAMALGSRGGVLCQDGVVRSACCCPKTDNDAQVPCHTLESNKPGCCQAVLPTAALSFDAESAAKKDRLRPVLILDNTFASLTPELAQTRLTPCGTQHSQGPPPGPPLFLKHRTLLI